MTFRVAAPPQLGRKTDAERQASCQDHRVSTPSHQHPEAPADPFAPAGILFRPVSPELVKARFFTMTVWLLPLAIACVVGLIVALVFGAVPGAIVAGAFLAVVIGLAVWTSWLIPRQVRALGYSEAADDLVLRRGILFKRLTVVPYGRMQFVDVHQGPVARRLGIASLKLHTAASTTDAALPGLPYEEAARLRDRLTARGEARMAGL